MHEQLPNLHACFLLRPLRSFPDFISTSLLLSVQSQLPILCTSSSRAFLASKTYSIVPSILDCFHSISTAPSIFGLGNLWVALPKHKIEVLPSCSRVVASIFKSSKSWLPHGVSNSSRPSLPGLDSSFHLPRWGRIFLILKF
jgi:hypothetical protein